MYARLALYYMLARSSLLKCVYMMRVSIYVYCMSVLHTIIPSCYFAEDYKFNFFFFEMDLIIILDR